MRALIVNVVSTQVKLTVVNDSKVIREEKGPNYTVVITSEVSGNTMQQVSLLFQSSEITIILTIGAII